MNTRLLGLFAALVIVFSGTRAAAQLSGTITIPSGTYPTLASAITALNAQGVGAGGVVINVTASETAPAGGYRMGSAVLNASTSVTQPITINGGGNTLTAPVGTSTLLDGVFTIRGTDYVTINALNVAESALNTTAATRMEWGYGLLKRSAVAPFDGCQNVTIQNCVITLSRLNANAKGIYFANHTDTGTTTIVITSPSDANSNNTIAGNSISNVYSGIWLSGFNQTAAPYNLYDQNNVVGGTAAAAGNTIQNYAGGTATTGYGIYLIYQNASTVRYNTVANAAGTGGAAGGTTLYGIFHGTGAGSSTNLSNNTVTVTQGAVTSTYYAINCAVTGSAVMNRNAISGTGGSSAVFYGLYSTGSLQNLSMDSNTVSGFSITTTGTVYLIYNASLATGVVSMKGNAVSNITRTSASGGTYVLYGSAASTATSTIEISGNTITGINTSAGSGLLYLLYDLNGATTGKPYKTVFNNTVNNITGGSGTIYAIRSDDAGSNANGTSAVYNNTVNNVSSAGIIYGLYTGVTETVNVYDNVVHTISSTGVSSALYGIYHSSGAAGTVNSYRNRVYNMTASGTTSPEVNGMYVTGAAGGLLNLYNNFVSDLFVPSGSANDAFFGIYLVSATPDYRIYHNTVRLNPTSTGTNFGGSGLYMTGTATATNTVDVRNNIINVNATAAGTGLVTAMQRSGGTAGTPPPAYALTSNGNILYAPNVANTFLYAEGTTAAAAVNKFSLANDPNFNTPCGLYKTFMTPRDNGTFTENNLSPVAGTPGAFVPTGTSFASNNAVPTASPAVTADFFGTARGNPADIGAVEFAGSGTDMAGPVIAYTPLLTPTLCSAPPTLNATISDASGVNTTAGTRPRLYYKKSTEANAFGGVNNSSFNGWKWVEATGSGPAFNFSPDYTLLTAALAAGDVIQYFVVAQDNASTPNVSSILAAYPSGFCPSSVALPAAAGPLAASPTPYSYTVGATPTAYTATSSPAQICVSGNVTLALNSSTAGLTVQWQSATLGGAFSNIAGATTAPYTLTGVSASTRYRAVVSCGGTVVLTTNEDTTLVESPAVLTTSATIAPCGGGTTTLTATGSAGTTLNWYAAASGGAPLATGPTFTTPFLSNTTTYYVGATSGNGSSGSVGPVNPAAVGSAGGPVAFDVYITYFTVTQATTLTSVDIYPSSPIGTTSSIKIYTGSTAGTTIATIPYTTTVTGTGATVAQTVPLNVPLAPGTYSIGMGDANVSLYRNSSGSVFPYTSAAINITGQSFSAGYYYYFYNWQFSTGCESPRTAVTAVVTPPATASATASGSTSICQGSSVTLNATPTGAGYNYQWFLNGAVIPGATSPTYAASQPGSYLVSVYTTITCNDTSNTPIVVTVTPVPTTVSPTAPVTLCSGSSQTLTGPAGTGLTYQWLLNNGIIAGATSQTYAANATGNYRVRVTTSGGCSDTSQPVSVTVVTTPLASVTPTAPAPICPNVGVVLSGPVNTSYTYQWFLNGAAIPGATAQTYTALAAGQYSLRTQVGSSACSAFSSPVVVTTSPLPPTAFTASNNGNICAGSTVTLTGPVDVGYTYQWLLNGSPVAGATAQTYTTAVAGNYRLKVTALATGCTDTSAATTLTARPLPAATTSPSGSNAICFNATQTLTANTGTGLTYQWLYNTAPIAGATAQTYSANASGQYAVRVTSQFGCVNTSTPYTLTVRPQPPGQISYTDPLQFCAGGAVVLTAAGGVPGYNYSYQWFRNGVQIPGANTAFYQAMLAGAYTLRAQDSAGCVANSPAVDVIVNPIPTVTISVSGDTLSALPAFYSQYQWYRNNQPITGATGPTYVAVQAGAYRVEAVDNNSCLGSSTSLYVATTGIAGMAAIGVPILVYPNPATSVLRIDAPIAVTATLRNGLGQTVLTERGATQLDIARFPDGLYTLTLTDGEGAVVLQEKISKVSR